MYWPQSIVISAIAPGADRGSGRGSRPACGPRFDLSASGLSESSSSEFSWPGGLKLIFGALPVAGIGLEQLAELQPPLAGGEFRGCRSMSPGLSDRRLSTVVMSVCGYSPLIWTLILPTR